MISASERDAWIEGEQQSLHSLRDTTNAGIKVGINDRDLKNQPPYASVWKLTLGFQFGPLGAAVQAVMLDSRSALAASDELL